MASTDDTGKPFDLDGQLDVLIQEYTEDREKHWASRSDGADWDIQQRLYGYAERIAKLLLRDTSSLTRADDSHPLDSETFQEELKEFLEAVDGQRQLQQRLADAGVPLHALPVHMLFEYRPDNDTLLKLVWERLCIVLTEDFAARLVPSANRTLRLMQLVVAANPSEATMRFLKRVSRCYVYGLDAECAILCRGAMDTAFKSAVPDSLLQRLNMQPGANYGYTLAQRIRAAREANVIDPDEAKAAGRVNGTATAAAHANPEIEADCFTLVQDVMRLIQKLNPRVQSESQ